MVSREISAQEARVFYLLSHVTPQRVVNSLVTSVTATMTPAMELGKPSDMVFPPVLVPSVRVFSLLSGVVRIRR